MQLFNFLRTDYSISCFSTITFSTLLLAASLANSIQAENLGTRQAPGVVTVSSFLRRGLQACECTQPELCAEIDKALIATVAGNWVYIDSGEFSYLDDEGHSVHELCELDFRLTWCCS